MMKRLIIFTLTVAMTIGFCACGSGDNRQNTAPQELHMWDEDGVDESHPDGINEWAEAIHAYTAWSFADECNTPVDVVVLEGGININHEEFDRGGITKITTRTSSDVTFAPDAHATAVAGIIGADDNTVGLRGIADKCNLISYDLEGKAIAEDGKVIPPDDSHFYYEYVTKEITNELTSGLIESINDIMNTSSGNNLVINISGGSYYVPSQNWYKKHIYKKNVGLTYEEYMDRLKQCSEESAESYISAIESYILNPDYPDFLIVYGAGNGYDNALQEGFNADGFSTIIPITYEAYKRYHSTHYSEVTYEEIWDHLLIVGAASKNKNGEYVVDPGSNYGSSVEIYAPGRNIYTTNYDYDTARNDTYTVTKGTSMSTPMVSGSAALLWQVNPTFTAGEIKQCLLDTAMPIKRDNKEDCKMLDIGQAVVESVAGTIGFEVKDTDGNLLSDVICTAENDDISFVNKELLTDEEGKIAFPALGFCKFTFAKKGYESLSVLYDIEKWSGQNYDIVLNKESPALCLSNFEGTFWNDWEGIEIHISDNEKPTISYLSQYDGIHEPGSITKIYKSVIASEYSIIDNQLVLGDSNETVTVDYIDSNTLVTDFWTDSRVTYIREEYEDNHADNTEVDTELEFQDFLGRYWHEESETSDGFTSSHKYYIEFLEENGENFVNAGMYLYQQGVEVEWFPRIRWDSYSYHIENRSLIVNGFDLNGDTVYLNCTLLEDGGLRVNEELQGDPSDYWGPKNYVYYKE